jgi:16S rRNA (cytosine1402-N4)-methyltransferase
MIAYHSIEDRLVKNFMKTGSFDGEAEKDLFGVSKHNLKMLTKKPLVPDEDELEENNRSRSAKMRVAVKK